ncbi:uncharacterized protein LOC134187613 [Corticium candelabrum]|uniref:uncharacterized protein LOC134187613 n=1 Tax=Corticium candelabrum TaxID=121492 RepID=UPI002E252872|nr:uncharacterized protein LOC134187613 [Corticium candelabrum]
MSGSLPLEGNENDRSAVEESATENEDLTKQLDERTAKIAVYLGTLGMFCDGLARTLPFPFLPWMVQEFKINGEFVTEDETGYYVGLITTLQFVGMALGRKLITK